jgi:hypothetical protein
MYYDDLLIGPRINDTTILYSYDDKEWEIFIEEWLSLKKDYVELDNPGGAGDKGRDVIAYINKDKPNYKWHNYQCKHYKEAIKPTDVWDEFGKIIYYTYIKDYPIPEKYYFVAPKGTGVKFTDLINNPEKLKEELKKNWDKYCKNEITSTTSIELKGRLLTYFNGFDFSIFERILPKTLIKEYKYHENYNSRFSMKLPTRSEQVSIPAEIQKDELLYTSQLLKAYNTDKTENNFTEIEEFSGIKKYNNHFNRARESFHNTEQLRQFSRDNLGEIYFTKFKKDIYTRIADTADEEDLNRFNIVKKVEKDAMDATIESNILKSRCEIIDKKGICHHLVNDGELKWVEEDE